MTLHPTELWEIPEETARIACAAFPKALKRNKMSRRQTQILYTNPLT